MRKAICSKQITWPPRRLASGAQFCDAEIACKLRLSPVASTYSGGLLSQKTEWLSLVDTHYVFIMSCSLGGPTESIYKICACDLVEESLAALDAAYSDVYVLPAAKFKFRINENQKKSHSKYGTTLFNRLHDFLAAVNEVEPWTHCGYRALAIY